MLRSTVLNIFCPALGSAQYSACLPSCSTGNWNILWRVKPMILAAAKPVGAVRGHLTSATSQRASVKDFIVWMRKDFPVPPTPLMYICRGLISLHWHLFCSCCSWCRRCDATWSKILLWSALSISTLSSRVKLSTELLLQSMMSFFADLTSPRMSRPLSPSSSLFSLSSSWAFAFLASLIRLRLACALSISCMRVPYSVETWWSNKRRW